MITVIRFVDIYRRSRLTGTWRVAKRPRYSLWLYFDELKDEGPDDDDGSYDEAWLSRNAVRLHGDWHDADEARLAADDLANRLRSQGCNVEVEDVVGD